MLKKHVSYEDFQLSIPVVKNVTLITTRERSCGKVIFSVVSVLQSFCPWAWASGEVEVQCDHHPLWITPHCTAPPPPDMRPHCKETPLLDMGPILLVAFGGQDYSPVETYLFTWGPPNCWHLVAIKACTLGTSGRYTSYWNAFLFIFFFVRNFLTPSPP